MYKFKCSCDKEMTITSNLVGKKIKCPKCKKVFTFFIGEEHKDKNSYNFFNFSKLIIFLLFIYIIGIHILLLFYHFKSINPKKSKDQKIRAYNDKLYLLFKDKEIKKQKNKNIFLKWIRLKILYLISPINQRKNILNQIKSLEEKIYIFLLAQKGEIRQLLQEKRENEIISRVTPRILSLLAQSLNETILPPNKKILKVWKSIIKLYTSSSKEY